MPFLITCPRVCVSFGQLRTRFVFICGCVWAFCLDAVALCWAQTAERGAWRSLPRVTRTFEESSIDSRKGSVWEELAPLPVAAFLFHQRS